MSLSWVCEDPSADEAVNADLSIVHFNGIRGANRVQIRTSGAICKTKRYHLSIK